VKQLFSAAVIVAMVGYGVAVSARTDVLPDGSSSPLFGTWELNVAKSDYGGPPPYKRVTCRIAPLDDRVRVTYDMVGLRGGVIHIEWTGRFDGNDYAVEGVDYVMTNAYVRIDDRTYDVRLKVDGRLVSIARLTVSPDGRTITTKMSQSDADGQEITTTTIYDRRE
jgi:hypothetical protein